MDIKINHTTALLIAGLLYGSVSFAQFIPKRMLISPGIGVAFPRGGLQGDYKMGVLCELKTGLILSDLWTITFTNQWQRFDSKHAAYGAFAPFTFQLGADFNVSYLLQKLDPDNPFTRWLNSGMFNLIFSGGIGGVWIADKRLKTVGLGNNVFEAQFPFKKKNGYTFFAFNLMGMGRKEEPSLRMPGVKAGVGLGFGERKNALRPDE